MLGINAILLALAPVLETIETRQKKGEATSLDAAIYTLAKKILSVKKCSGTLTIEGFEVVNTHLSDCLTLADLKISLKCGPGVTETIVKYLQLQKNLEKIRPKVLERIETVAEDILEHVTLFDLQLAGIVHDVFHSGVWYALSTDEEFLKRNIVDLQELNMLKNLPLVRIRNIEKNSPHLLMTLAKQFSKREITIGKLRLLKGGEINQLAKKIPPFACSLLSDDQVRSVEFSRFSQEQLDKMIEGGGAQDEIRHRLGILNGDQITFYLTKSSGCYFGKFSDSFFQTLELSKLTKKQILSLFDLNESDTKRHLQQVPPEEIAKGLHLLSDEHLMLLAPSQLGKINYRRLSLEHFNLLFYACSEQTKIARVPSIPFSSLEYVLTVNHDLLKYFSKEQCLVLDPDLLDENMVRAVFPGFSLETLHFGYRYKKEEVNGKIRHKFELKGVDFSRMVSYSQTELEDLINKRKLKCLSSIEKFSNSQIKVLLPKMAPEVRSLLFRYSS